MTSLLMLQGLYELLKWRVQSSFSWKENGHSLICPPCSEADYDKYFPYESRKAPTDFQEWPMADTVITKDFNTNQKSVITLAPKKSWLLGKYVAILSTQDSLGNAVEARKYFDLFDSKAKQLSIPELLMIETDKSTYQMDEKVKVRIGSSAPDISVTLDIHRNNAIVETRIIRLSDEIKTVEIPVKNTDKDGFALLYQYVNLNQQGQGTLNLQIAKALPKLEVNTTTFRDKLLPGAEETWSFQVLGENKKAAEAEMLASMYDASLDQFKPHQWSFTPFTGNSYNAYNTSRPQGFDLQNFSVRNLNRNYYRYPTVQYDDFNWFGFSFSGNNYLNRQYLSRLRSVFFTQDDLTITSTQDKSKPAGFIYGQIMTEDGEPLPGVNVLVKGTRFGATTDLDGFYRIAAKKGEELLIAYIGMESTEIMIKDQNTIDVVLKMDLKQLSEVVVIGYGERRTSSYMKLDANISETTQIENMVFQELADEELLDVRLQGGTSGVDIDWKPSNIAGDGWNWTDDNKIIIRGNGSISSGNQPLYIVDGKIATNQELTADQIASMEVLKGAAATDLYGARAANGVIIITTKKGQAQLDKMLSRVQARTDLRETAFFYPQLKTDAEGNVSFSFDTPEALTRWKLQLLAHNKSLAVGYKSLQTVTQKELMVSPNAPRFLRKGDVLLLSAKISNLSTEALNGTVVLVLTDAISGQAVDLNFKNTDGQQNFNVGASNTTEVSWQIEVPDDCEALQHKVIATTGNFSDGEQNIIPILPSKELVTESLPFTMRSAGTETFTFDRLKNNQSNPLQHHQLTFELTTNPIWYAIKAMPYLMEYPYECSEQTFSRYFANRLGSHILAQHPTIKTIFEKWQAAGNFESKLEQNAELKNILIQETPWLRDAQSEAEQQKRIALLFDLEKMEEQFKASLGKLEEMQLDNGGFPWFSGSGRANRYITQYILMGLGQLQQIDTETSSIQLQKIISNGIQYLDQQIAEDYRNLLKASKSEDSNIDLSKQQLSNLQVQLLYARSFYREEIPASSQKAYTYYHDQAKTYWKSFDLKLRGMIALALFRGNESATAFKIIASLRENSITSAEMGMYWKANTSGYYWTQSPIETQAMLIGLFNEIGAEMPDVSAEQLATDLENMKVWLLRNKQTNKWPTTKATTQAIYALLLDKGEQLTQTDEVAIKIGSQTIETGQQAIGAGYLKESWAGEVIDETMANIQVTKQQDGLAFGAVYWQYFESLDKITGNSSGPLSLTKKVFKLTRDATGEMLQAVTDTTKLQLDDHVRIRIVLQADRKMEFLHMKDQRAAGLEPVAVISEYKWQDGLGYYQSTKDASTNFFFDDVQKGVYVFEYDLVVNNAGTFLNGITTIESMYAPEFKSHSEGIKLELVK